MCVYIYIILHHLNILFFLNLFMWEDGPSLTLEFFYRIIALLVLRIGLNYEPLPVIL
jgi:hypothetical protein